MRVSRNTSTVAICMERVTFDPPAVVFLLERISFISGGLPLPPFSHYLEAIVHCDAISKEGGYELAGLFSTISRSHAK